MSTTTEESLPSSPKLQESPPISPQPELRKQPDNYLSDLMLWRRKYVNVGILLAATATWVMLDVYHFYFISLASWVGMALVAFIFFQGNVSRLLGKEVPDLLELEIDEPSMMEKTRLLRERAEQGVQWFFRLGIEREWFATVGAMACLYLVSLLASYLDLLTLGYIGVVGAMTVPVIYVKYEDKITEYGRRLKMKSHCVYASTEEKMRRFYASAEETVRKMRNKLYRRPKEVKEKKTE